jgi:hypothetical protein
MTKISENKKHIWRFSRIGGVDRVCLDNGADLANLEHLDQKLWTALSCPVYGMEIDPKTLELMDTDKDERIRVPEVLAAVKWILSLLKNPDDLLKQAKELPLSAIDENNVEGKKLLASAKQILANIEKSDSSVISVEDTSDTKKIFAKTKFNGDGIITADSTDDPDLKNLINDIIACAGSVMDRSGNHGISQDLIDAFYKNCQEYSDWNAKAETNSQKILPYGAATEEALIAFNAIKSKIDDYFIRCRLAEFDRKSADVFNLLQDRYEAIRPKDLSANMAEIATYPIAKIEAEKPLPLDKGINPAWETALSNLKQLVIIPEIGDKKNISDAEWTKLSDKFNDYTSWKAEKAGIACEKLGLAKVREILSNHKKAELEELILKDKELEENANSIFQVDKLVRYYRDLFKLLRNFVSFYDFYSPAEKAIFQVGTLYLDRRSCELCIKVSNMPKHGSMAGLSGMYLIYCDCVSKYKNEKMTIVAALTNGDIDNLMVGRNAIFYDRNGLDWDATIIKIVENPISIRQAFWTPYRKIAKFVGDQIEKMAASRESQVHANATAQVQQTSTNAETGQKPPAQPFDMGKYVGIFAAIGLAIGAIGTAVASILSGFMGLSWWKMPLAILGIMLIISGPSMIIAWLKLRKRNLSPVLDANGWAINARVAVNIVFGNTLTHLANLPKNAKRDLNDPFAKKKKPVWLILLMWIIVLGAATVVLWHFGLLKAWGIIQ